ncbi:insulinase family protein [Candidatus Chlamydia sanziniae]|uniref:Metalloprotease, insulinase family n=1 Tax=Candidatus Chlamydia sanziniae TaxID=1806891 RepID=A0A1A9HUU1_9CHLA|nr:insulinase family protein [Candidatus Chlamydia sanziniae]ANH78770.1 Metalloprotease, insulinase family [Candidatus Chlamydia sanziniae]
MKTGDTYRNFIIKSCEGLPEIESKLLEAEHKPSGASIMMIINDDDENVFNICFRTCPQSSNGVAHVLEHMVLCGSENYPVRDPFFSMTRRSLNTFMNAFTGADFTCYPAASQISEDFYNLLSVYIDAVFHPLLTKNSFFQEGWRYEFSPENKLFYTGVVFNEMKGAMMSGETRLSEALNAALFPSVTYGVNSGGEPKEIVTLSRKDIWNFHQSQYTLNRCLFYFYGNIKPSRHLDFLEEKLLRHASKIEKQTITVPLQKRFKTPIRHIFPYPSSSQDENKVLFGISWLTCSILDQQELLALHVLEIVLMGTDAAPLKSRLLKSDFCKQAEMSIDSELREIPITLVCKGCSPHGAQKLEAWIFACLEEIINEGIAENIIEGAVHQLELARKEISGYSLPYGLSLFFRSGLLKQHGGYPQDALKIHSLFSDLRLRLTNSDYLPKLIRKYFLDNTHFVRIVLIPDSELLAKENTEEQTRLKQIQDKLSPEEIETIQQNTKILEKSQNQEQKLDHILPNFSLDKVPTSSKEFTLIKEFRNEGEVFYHECFTNDIIFVDVVLDIPPLSVEELPWLRLLVFLILQLGSGGRSYKEQLEFFLEHTGGLDVSYDFSPHVNKNTLLSPSVSIRGKVLAGKAEKLFQVMRDILTHVNFADVLRIKELLMQHSEALTNSVRNSPMSYAVSMACADKSITGMMSYLASGLPYVKKICDLTKNFDKQKNKIITTLQALFVKCFSGKRQLVISGSQHNYEQLKENNFYGLLDYLTIIPEPWVNPNIELTLSSQGLYIPAPTAFNALAFPIGNLSYDHPDAVALTVAAEILDNVVLHTKIREHGGAYGSGAALNLAKGSFYCYSYRDPEIATTYQACLEGIAIIANGKFTKEDIHEGVLGVIQSLDSPVSPGSRGSTAFYRLKSGRVPALRQGFRRGVLLVTKEHICEVMYKYLQQNKQTTFISFAGEKMLENNASMLEKHFPIQPAL